MSCIFPFFMNTFVVGFDDAKMETNGCNKKGIRLLEKERVQNSTGIDS